MVHVPSIFLASVGGCPSRFDMKCDEAGYRYGSSETKIFIVLPCNITLFSWLQLWLAVPVKSVY